MKYKVFADQHHFGLYNSLKLLFEDRLGGELYRPIGEDWLHKGYWRMAEIYNNHPTTIAQYLGIRPDYKVEDDVYRVYDPEHECYQRAITYDKFMSLPIDIVIASIPEHIESFKRLAAEHPNKPKFIYQIGNAWPIEAGTAPNIMASAKISGVPSNIHFIEYHQEFSTKIFKPFNPNKPEKTEWDGYTLLENDQKLIYSFINCLNTASIYAADWPLFLRLEQMTPDWKWRTFGGSCRDGDVKGEKGVAEAMRQARFVWHVKAGGDGFGHVLHNAFAMGRPVIVKKSYYFGKLGEQLLIDGVTCIDIDNLSPQEIVDKINYYDELSRYREMCLATYEQFKKVCDFDKEFGDLQNFLENLIY